MTVHTAAVSCPPGESVSRPPLEPVSAAGWDAGTARRWVHLAATRLHARRADIDRLNVFPVADADTGTNLAVTMRAAAEACADDAIGPGARDVLAAAAGGAAQAARGNSGIILAAWLAGLAEATDLREAFVAAATGARRRSKAHV